MASYSVEITGDEARLFKSLQKVIDKEKELGRASQEAGRMSEHAERGAVTAANEHVGALDRVQSSVTRVITTYGGIQGIRALIAGLNSEFKNLLDLQARAGETQRGIAGAEQDVIRNLVGMPVEERAKLIERFGGLAAELNIPREAIMAAAAEAVSASGGNIEAAFAAVEQAAKYVRDKPGDIPLVAGALQDLARVTGSQDMAVNQGFLAAVGAMSRITKPTLQASNIAPALIGMVANETDPRLAAALFAAQTTESGEKTGEMSGTALIKFTEQVREFFTEGKGKRVGAQIAPDTGARIEALWADPKLRDAFMKDLSVDAKAGAPIRNLIEQGPAGSMGLAVSKALQAVPTNEQAAAAASLEEQARAASQFEPVADVSRLLATATQAVEMADLRAGYAGEAFESAIKLIAASGATEKQVARLREHRGFALGANKEAIEHVAGMLEERAAGLESPVRSLTGAAPLDPARMLPIVGDVLDPGIWRGGHTPSEQDLANAQRLRAAAAEVRSNAPAAPMTDLVPLLTQVVDHLAEISKTNAAMLQTAQTPSRAEATADMERGRKRNAGVE